jgi:hypothetical protein
MKFVDDLVALFGGGEIIRMLTKVVVREVIPPFEQCAEVFQDGVVYFR